MASGPLKGIRVLEFAGIGPAPFCGMLLSDLGADVVRLERENQPLRASDGFILRGRRSLALNLKDPQNVRTAAALAARADILIEGFRPGIMEKLGLGPDVLLAANPRLIYGRMTGWGQFGPLAKAAGHDINYIALSGALHAIGMADKPLPPLNLVGDFGGGALYLAFGLLAALIHVRAGGRGQVVDCAITDGTASIMSMMYAMKSVTAWSDERRSNLLDGGAPFYDTYICADGRWISIGALEPQFYDVVLEKTGLSKTEFADQLDEGRWPALRAALTQVFASKTRAEWCAIFEGTDACFAPVLSMNEAPHHPHNRARGTFVTIDGVIQAAPAPRFSKTPGAIQGPPGTPESDPGGILHDWVG
jgi:alpha-methylacyl-CoA racemase